MLVHSTAQTDSIPEIEETRLLPLVKIVTVDLPIGPISERIILRAIDIAEEESADAVIIELNTPGGLDTSMRNIIKRILHSEVPVISYVSPSGSRAASAGVFISYSAHVAAMAPGTNIGAAHPVNMGGQMDSTMSEKVANDAAAYIRSLASRRGRNAEWAEDAVYKSVSITAKEALEKNVIDIVAKNTEDLLEQCTGKEINIGDTTAVLQLKDARVERVDITFSDEVLKIISDPNIAYILLSIGMMGLYFEFSNPGAILPGVIGGICLILAFFALSTLPINIAGLLLMFAAGIMFILEIKITSHGILTIGGILSMLIGSMMLIDTEVPYLQVSLSVIIVVVAATAAFFIFAVGFAIKAQKKQVTTGTEGLIGQKAKVYNDFSDGKGQVLLHGERWRAESGQELKKGDNVKVVSIDNLTVKVEKIV
ncbi:MAG: nodulation protein NfeD [candidate division Zixibacteria bacterium]|nr:nodulation protein NfeD [candidate division Zixibacteria bacterium]